MLNNATPQRQIIATTIAVILFLSTLTAQQKNIYDNFLKSSPVSFRKNVGQWDDQILYQGGSPGWDANVYFLKNGLSFGFKRLTEKPGEDDSYENIEYMVWNQYFKNTSSGISVEASGKHDSRTNYFFGANNHQNNVPDYSQIHYKNVYKNIDVRYYNTGSELKYDYIIGKGANINDIEISLDGVQHISLNEKGQLEIHTAWGTLIDEIPESYQLINGQKTNCEIVYHIIDEKTYGFKIKGDYNKNEELILDPVNLLWSTFVGGTSTTGNGYLRDMTVDAAGNVYATGWYTNSFPVTPGSYNNVWSGGAGLFATNRSDVFVLKLDATGSNLIFATYIGGSNNEEGLGIEVANNGDIYVCGFTKSTLFPTTTGAYDVTHNNASNNDAFFLKLNNAGNTLLYSTFLGGAAASEQGNSVAIAANGDAIMAGTTGSSNFSVTTGSVQQIIGGGNDGFVARIAPNGAGNADLVFSTFIGGALAEAIVGTAVNSSGEIFICGYSSSTNYPTTAGAFATNNTASSDVVLSKISANGASLLYSTYLGGTLSDIPYEIDLDASGNVFVAGYTASTDFPITQGAYDTSYNGGGAAQAVKTDVFVTKINTAGTGINDLIFSTYVGGSGNDVGSGIAVNSLGECFVSGFTMSSDFPMTSCAYDPTYNATAASNGAQDLFLFKLDAAGSTLQYSTYVGGLDADYAEPVVEIFGSCEEQVYMSTTTHSQNFPTTAGAFQSTKFNTTWDQPAILSFKETATVGFKDSLVSASCNGIMYAFTDTSKMQCSWNSASWTPTTWQWSFGDGSTSTLQHPTHLYTAAGTYNVKLVVSCPKDSITFPLTVSAPQLLSAFVPSQTNLACYGDSSGSATAAALNGNAPFTYNWSTIPAQNNIAATGLKSGVYTVTITDNTGCNATASVNITEPTQVVVTPSANTIICSGSTTTISANATGGSGVFIYSWTPVGASGQSISVSPTTQTTYSVIAIDSNGCVSIPQTLTVSIANNPIALNVSAPVSICEGASTTLTASATGGNGNYNFNWQPNNVNGNSLTVSPSNTTTFMVIATDNCNSTPDSSLILVTVNKLPVLSVAASDTAGCPPLCVNFTLLRDSSLVQTNWSFGDGGFSSTTGNQNHCYITTGIYTVSLSAMDANGCIASLTKNNWINVYPVPTAAFASTPQPATILNSTIYFNNNSIGHTSSIWSFGDAVNSLSTLENPSFTYPDSGKYEVTLVVANTYGCTDTATDYVVINTDYIFYAPNAFTPNEDNLNPEFKPVMTGVDAGNYELLIFDRWGNMIFKTNDLNKGWNGHANSGNDIAQIDTYIWKARFLDIFGNKHQLLGQINLIR